MTDSPETLKARRTWVETYRQTGHAGLTCRRCGISRPTLRKWSRRFEADGEAGLTDRVLSLRRDRNLGSKRLQAELIRLEATRLSTSTIHRVLADAKAKPIRRSKRPKQSKCYNRPTAGDRVQIDSTKVAKGMVQFTAVDDCTRMRVLGLYPDKTGVSAAHFFEEWVLKELPFPIERVQSDSTTGGGGRQRVLSATSPSARSASTRSSCGRTGPARRTPPPPAGGTGRSSGRSRRTGSSSTARDRGAGPPPQSKGAR